MQTYPYSVIGEHGEVLATGTTTDRALIPGQVLDRAAPPGHWWDEASDTFVPIQPQPSPAHAWDWPSHAWVDVRDVDAWRRQKWQEVKAERARRIAAGVEVAGLGTFDADERAAAAVQQQLTLMNATVGDFSVRWTLHASSGNAPVTLDRHEFARVALGVLAHIPAMHAIARELRDRIDAPGASIGELVAVRWPA